MLEREAWFVVRMSTQRDMTERRGKARNVLNIAQDIECPKKAEFITHPKGESPQRKTISIGYQEVSFREDKNPTLIVIKVWDNTL